MPTIMTSSSNMNLPVRARSGSQPRIATGSGTQGGTLTRSARVIKTASRNSSPQHTQRQKGATMSKARSKRDALATLWTGPDSFYQMGPANEQLPSMKAARPSSWHHVQDDFDVFTSSPWEVDQPYLDSAFPSLFPSQTNGSFQYPSRPLGIRSTSNLRNPDQPQSMNYGLTDASIANDLFAIHDSSMPSYGGFQSQMELHDNGFTMAHQHPYMLQPQPLIDGTSTLFEGYGQQTGRNSVESGTGLVLGVEGKDEGEELVGMGLYDDPRDTSAWDLQSDEYQSLLLGAVGKGLKLEESFIPRDESPSSDGEDSSNEEEDAAEEEDDQHPDTAWGPSITHDTNYTFSNAEQVSPHEPALPQFDFSSQDYETNGWTDDQILTSFTADDLDAAVILNDASHNMHTNYLYSIQH